MQAQSRLAGGAAPEDEHEAAVIRELTRGHELTARLQAEALRALRGHGQAEATASFILREVSRAFTVCLSIVRSSPARAPPPPSAGRVRDDSIPRKQTLTHSPHVDGYQWRKYGQKRITNTNFPRCYFRCSLHRERGCPATKQVQRHGGGDPPQYLVIYVNEHTCDTATWEPEAAAAGAVTANAPLDLSSSSFGLTATTRRHLLLDERGVQEEHELVSSLACVLGCRSPAAATSAVAVGPSPSRSRGPEPEPPLQGRARDASASVVVGAPPDDVMDAGLHDAMDYDTTAALYFDGSYGPGLSDDGFPF